MKSMLILVSLLFACAVQAQTRNWTTKKGETFQGTYLSLEDGVAMIMVAQSKVKRIFYKELSKADQEFLQQKLYQLRAAAMRRRAQQAKNQQTDALAEQGSATLDEIVAQREAEEADRKAQVEADRAAFKKKMAANKKKNQSKKGKGKKKGKKK